MALGSFTLPENLDFTGILLGFPWGAATSGHIFFQKSHETGDNLRMFVLQILCFPDVLREIVQLH